MSSRVVKAREAYLCHETWRVKPFPGRETAVFHGASDAEGDNIVVDPAELIDIARRKAEAIIKDSMASAAEISRQAREQGYADGCKEGLLAGRAEASDVLSKAQEAAAAIERERQEILVRAEAEVAMLAVKIASLIVKREVVQEPESVVYMVRDALQRVRDEARVSVRLNPTDAVVVKGALPSLIAATGARQIDIVEDPTMGMADCIVSTARGEIDERVDQQLKRIESALRSVDLDGAI